eukprot:5128350-Prymnesium_polylepis.1
MRKTRSIPRRAFLADGRLHDSSSCCDVQLAEQRAGFVLVESALRRVRVAGRARGLRARARDAVHHGHPPLHHPNRLGRHRLVKRRLDVGIHLLRVAEQVLARRRGDPVVAERQVAQPVHRVRREVPHVGLHVQLHRRLLRRVRPHAIFRRRLLSADASAVDGERAVAARAERHRRLPRESVALLAGRRVDAPEAAAVRADDPAAR